MPGSSTSGSWAQTFGSRPRTPLQLRELREAIRALTIASQAGQLDPAPADTVRRASRTARLRVAVDDAGQTVLEPDRPTVDGAVAALLGSLHEAQQPDQEPRLPATPLQHDQPMTTMDATASSSAANSGDCCIDAEGVVKAPRSGELFCVEGLRICVEGLRTACPRGSGYRGRTSPSGRAGSRHRHLRTIVVLAGRPTYVPQAAGTSGQQRIVTVTWTGRSG